ncbi:P-loop containing nucleoside triphosphate hydrolase [Phytophthora cactorum]|nr:P-loop containing nucleoside triphosphate hydrolase [Phytophthora cactorum]
MHIEEIILDGFKSYATRTVVSGFDPRFNAITGLNGSGKSNVLDAICFVLGITNLSQVRANNLQELVYKQGQAGVTKASVTIVFNNQDAKASPVGYEQYEQISVARQVVIGGRNKYLINGHTAQVSQVQNLFHSVQLNVNNPHFLIMQGRITKVLNMKPPEILGMIEEAAGTRMYENKKLAALKTMTKKEKKDEINSILANEITPTLEKLRAEKTHYLKGSVAHDYQKAQDALTNTAQHVEKMQQAQRAAKEQEAQIEQEIEQEQREKEMGKEFQQLKDNFTTKLKHCKASIEQQAKTKVNQVEESYTAKETEANDYQRQIQALNAGMEQSGDSDESLSERLARDDNRSMDEERKHKISELEHMQRKVDDLTSSFNPDEEQSSTTAEVDEISSGLSSRLDFKYTDPYRNFKRESVMGLYQIVVDNEKTAKDILKFGRLMNRVTIIPLNRISRKTWIVAQQQGGKVWEAMELIHFKPNFCQRWSTRSALRLSVNKRACQECHFHRDIKVRTVTLDVIRMTRLVLFKEVLRRPAVLQSSEASPADQPHRELSDMRREYQDCSRALDDMKQDSGHFRQLKHQIELKEHELRLLDERIADSVFAQLNATLQLQKSKGACVHLAKEVKSLDADIANLKESRQSKIGVLEKRFAEAKKETQKIGVHLRMFSRALRTGSGIGIR